MPDTDLNVKENENINSSEQDDEDGNGDKDQGKNKGNDDDGKKQFQLKKLDMAIQVARGVVDMHTIESRNGHSAFVHCKYTYCEIFI